MEQSFINDLERSSNELLQSIEGLTDAQLNFKINALVWSIHECIEHIVITEIAVYRILMHHSETEEENSNAERIGKQRMEKIMSDRSIKTESPESVKPIGRFNSLKELRDKFCSNRERIMTGLKDNSIVFDNELINHPMLGEMTKRDWLNFLIHHCERHCKQIGEIKSVVQLQALS